MDTRSLRLFLSLADSLSFTRTAEQLHMSPSAVSRALQRIEADVGQRLVERDKRSVRLTRAGLRFHDYARRSLEQWQQITAELHQDPERLAGEISVYGSVTASYSVLSPILERFRRDYPAIEFMLRTGDQAEAIGRVQAGQEDIAVAACPDDLSPRLDFLALLDSPLAFIAPAFDCAVSEQLVQGSERAQLSQVPFILAERGLSRDRLDQWCRREGIKPRVYAQVTGHEAIAAMVGLGLGVGVIPRLVLDSSLSRDKLRVLDIGVEFGPFPVGLCALRQRLDNPLVRAFWDVAAASYLSPK